MADSERSAATVLERLMPTSQAAERRSATIAASADHVWAALAQVTIGELRLFRLLMGFWVLPGRLLGSPRARFDADEPLLDWAVRFGFTILGEEARRELVVGAIGQPWRPVLRSGLRPSWRRDPARRRLAHDPEAAVEVEGLRR
jgi:hypothetical protein